MWLCGCVSVLLQSEYLSLEFFKKCVFCLTLFLFNTLILFVYYDLRHCHTEFHVCKSITVKEMSDAFYFFYFTHWMFLHASGHGTAQPIYDLCYPRNGTKGSYFFDCAHWEGLFGECCLELMSQLYWCNCLPVLIPG